MNIKNIHILKCLKNNDTLPKLNLRSNNKINNIDVLKCL